MKAKVYISYKEGILDPQGKTVGGALDSMGIQGIEDLRIGKYIEIDFGNISKQKAEEITDESCRKLLANPKFRLQSLTRIYAQETKGRPKELLPTASQELLLTTNLDRGLSQMEKK